MYQRRAMHSPASAPASQHSATGATIRLRGLTSGSAKVRICDGPLEQPVPQIAEAGRVLQHDEQRVDTNATTSISALSHSHAGRIRTTTTARAR